MVKDDDNEDVILDNIFRYSSIDHKVEAVT